MMTLLEHIRNQPKATKVRLIGTIAIILIILLIIVWVFTSHIHSSTAKDTSFFQALGNSFANFKYIKFKP